MKMHHLGGCAPVPLAHYLKALGVLRIVSEQLDPEARGWWEGERFVLATVVDERDLVEFFLERYEPTPVFNPWGARSGFYGGSSEKTSRDVLKRIAEAPEKRLARFKSAVEGIRRVVDSVAGGSKPEDSEGVNRLVLELRNALRGAPLAWLESVLAVVDSKEQGIEQPALFGTGGSEGSGGYPAAFMKAVRECVVDHKWDHGIPHALFGGDRTPAAIWAETFGQFLPTGLGTPWDLILAFEGGCVVSSSVVKRSDNEGNRWLSSPFFFAPVAIGFSSSARIDEFVLNKGKELPGRGEQWFPLWSTPMSELGLRALFAQGRIAAGRRVPKDGLGVAHAIARYGMSNGVTSFIRFGYLQRKNQSTHLAVPLGRFVVPDRPATRLACLDDLDAWLPRLRRLARDGKAPTRLVHAERRLANTIFGLVQHPEEPGRWQEVLLALADIEAIQVTGSGYQAGPIPRLRPEWIGAADDGSAELRLAVAFALQAEEFDVLARPVRGTGVRRHWLTLKGARYATTGVGGQTRLFHETDRVFQGRNGVEDAIALVTRRLVESSKKGDRMLPLRSARRAHASVVDLTALVEGRVDLDRTIALGRALLAVDSRRWATSKTRVTRPRASDIPDDGWLAIRLAHLPWPLPDGRRIPTNPSIIRRLEGGDAAGAVALALRALRAAGIGATVRTAGVSPSVARLWAAALAFPISRETSNLFLRRLDPQASEETAA